MTSERQPGEWFTLDQSEGVRDYFAVYFANHARIQETTMAAVLEDPVFGPMVRATPPEQLRAQNEQSLAQLHAGLREGWAEYERQLRIQGAVYAKMGIAYEAWYRLIRSSVDEITATLVEAYRSDTKRLLGALQVMHTFLDRVMGGLAEAYLETKEAALRESEQRLATTLDSIGDGVIATDLQGRVERMNPIAEALTGWTLTECTGRPLAEVFRIENEETGAPVDSPVQSVLRDGAIVGLANHTVLVRRDGTRRPIADSAAPIRAPNGEMRGVVLVFRDQSEERAAARELHASRARKAAILEAAHDAILAMDADGTITEFNPAAERIFGRRRDDVLGQAVADVIVPEGLRTAHRKGLARYLETRESRMLGKRLELPAVRANGTEFVAEVTITAIASDGAPAFVGFLRDLTEQKRLEEIDARSAALELQNRRIREANRLKSEFLANMSHELRTPLNAIIGFSELIHDELAGPVTGEQKEFLGDILASSRHLLQLINDVLDLSKVEAGKLELHTERLEVGRVIGEVASILRATSASKRVHIEVVEHPDVQEVELDSARLKQVLYNYLSNALKFTREGGHVVVRVAPETEATFRIEVQDDGIGIAPQDMGKLFVEFQQIDTGAGKKHGGTGLGLALTKRIVEAHGGSVGVRSAVGEGSTFHAILPRRAAGGTPAPAAVVADGVGGSRPRVLVIEDSPGDRAMIVRTLEGAGYAVDSAPTGGHAIAMCDATKYAAITLDLILPDMSGLDVLRTIRARGGNAEAPVVVITVIAEHATAGFAVHDVLAKPIDGAALLSSLRRAGVQPQRGGRVLVVDDDPAALKLMAATLEQLGYQANCFADPAAALRSTETERPAAVILDLMMPEVDGFEFLDRFRESLHHRSIPVLVWSIKDLSRDERQHLRDAASAVLQKGKGASELVTALRSVLGPSATAPREEA